MDAYILDLWQKANDREKDLILIYMETVTKPHPSPAATPSPERKAFSGKAGT